MNNLMELCNKQADLDGAIKRKKPTALSIDDQFDNTLVALDVELSEFANEGRWFKIWSVDQEPRNFQWSGLCEVCAGCGCRSCAGTGDGHKNPLLEEFVDAVHFFLSLANLRGWQPSLNFNERILSSMYDSGKGVQRFNTNYLEMKNQLSRVFAMRSELAFGAAWMNFLIIGMSGFGFTWEQISEAYLAKNKINHERQANGY